MTHHSGLPPTFVDVLFCVLIFYVVATVLLVRGVTDPNASQERVLPPIDLPQMLGAEEDQPGGVGPTIMVVSMRHKNGALELLVADKPVSIRSLEERLGLQQPQEVCLRVDKAVTHGEEMRVIDLAMKQGVGRVTFAYAPQ